MPLRTEPLLDDLVFPEGPRWRDGKLWFSDMHDHRVRTVDLEGNADVIVEIDDQPSGLGWLPDGRLLIVSMVDKCLLRLDEGGLVEVADLSEHADGHCNDMVVDGNGNAYIGNFGFDLMNPPESMVPPTAAIILVTPQGRTSVVADGLGFPNGMVIMPDGRTLVVAETFAARLSAFTIENGGTLSKRRDWAAFDDLGVGFSPDRIGPDGICLDADDGIWLASPVTGEVIRTKEGGTITDRFKVETLPYACMLGGDDGCTLFVLTAPTHVPEDAQKARGGRIETVHVDVPRAGLP